MVGIAMEEEEEGVVELVYNTYKLERRRSEEAHGRRRYEAK